MWLDLFRWRIRVGPAPIQCVPGLSGGGALHVAYRLAATQGAGPGRLAFRFDHPFSSTRPSPIHGTRDSCFVHFPAQHDHHRTVTHAHMRPSESPAIAVGNMKGAGGASIRSTCVDPGKMK